MLSKRHSTKRKTLLAQPFGQSLRLLSTALSGYQVAHYLSKPLPCINNPQIAAKTNLKSQQTLLVTLLLPFAER